MPLKNVNILKLVEKSEGYVGADIEGVCKEAGMLALRDDIKAKEVAMKHFEAAMKKVRPSVTQEVEDTYEEMKQHFSAAKAKEMKTEKPAYFG